MPITAAASTRITPQPFSSPSALNTLEPAFASLTSMAVFGEAMGLKGVQGGGADRAEQFYARKQQTQADNITEECFKKQNYPHYAVGREAEPSEDERCRKAPQAGGSGYIEV